MIKYAKMQQEMLKNITSNHPSPFIEAHLPNGNIAISDNTFMFMIIPESLYFLNTEKVPCTVCRNVDKITGGAVGGSSNAHLSPTQISKDKDIFCKIETDDKTAHIYANKKYLDYFDTKSCSFWINTQKPFSPVWVLDNTNIVGIICPVKLKEE